MTRHSSGRFDIRFLARAVALAGTVVAVSVCGEQGGFGPTGSGADTEKPVVRVDLGPTDTLVEIADSLKFTVIVTENVRLASVHVDIAGLAGFVLAGVWDTTIASGTLTVFTKTYAAALPSNAAGQRIAITVSAKDASNNEGIGGDTVRVNDAVGPVVTLITPAAGIYIGAGDTIDVLAKAVDPSGIRTLGARLYVLDTVLQTIVVLAQDTLSYTSRSTLRQDSFQVVVPVSLSPGAYLLHAFAVDSSPAANDSQSVEIAVNVRDIRSPTGTFNGPALDSQVVIGDTLPISFHATDNIGVTSVRFRGYRLRRDPLLGPPDTVLCFDTLTARFPLLPADTNPIVRRLVPIVANETTDSVLIEASVTDVGGNVTTVTRRIQVIAGARAVTIQGPPLDTAVSAGDSVLVLFRVEDRRGITDVTVEGVALRGDSQLGTNEFVPRFHSRTISLSAARDTTLRRYLKADSSDLRAEPVFVRVSFSGAAGDTTSALRRIQVVAGASVRLLSPASGLTHPVGATLAITVTGFDPDSVAKLGYVSSGAIASSDSSVFTSPLSTAQSAALTLAVPNTAPLQSPDTIRPFVVDRLGNRAWGASAIVTFADSSSPTVAFASPTADTGVVAGDSVLVRVRLQDNRRGVAVSIDGGRFFSTVGVQGLNSTDTTVGRYLLFDGNLADAPDTASIIARVTDGAGLQSADTLRIQVTSGPYVRITDPANGSQVRLGQGGARILPVVSAFNPDTITYLGFQATGRITKNDSMATTRPVTSTTLAQQLALDVPDTTRLGTVTLTPFVRTRSGARLSGAAISVELVDGSLPVVRILTPARAGTDSLPAGDSLFVRVSAVDDRELSSLRIAGYARRPDLPDTLGSVIVSQRFEEKVVDLTGTVRDTVVRYLNAVLTDSTTENAHIVATLTDAAGNVGVDTVKVKVITGPSVRVTAPAAGLRHPVGTTLNVTVSGSDPHNLTYVGFVARGVVARADSVAVSPAAATSTQTLAWAVPAAAALGVDTLVPFARNAAGLRFYGAAVVISLADTVVPTITVLGPALDSAVGVGDSVRVRVQVTDNRGVARVQTDGVQLQGDSSLGTATLLARLVLRTDTLPEPTDTTLTRYLTAVQGQTAVGAIFIRVIATDSSGNQTTAWRRITLVAGPYVQISAPTAPAVQPIGATMNVTIVAYDPNGLTRVGFLATGAVTGGDSISYSSPLATTQTSTRTLAIPATARGTAVVTPFSVDSLGNRLIGTALSVALSDTAKPTVSLDTPAVAATPFAMGDSVYLSVHATDNLGLARIVLTGVARRGSALLGTDTSVVRFTSKTITLPSAIRDTVLKRYLLPLLTDSTSELVDLIATAYDSTGNALADTTSIRIVGGPTMTVVRPTVGAATSVGKSVIIEIRGVDPNGTRLVGWRATGVLTGQDSAFFSPVSGALADTATFTDTLVIPALTPLGTLTITPFGLDSLGDVSGTIPGVAVTVQSSAGDLTAPSVRFAVDRRVEIDDSITVTATDAGGLKRLGFRATLLDTTTVVGTDSTVPDLNGTLSDVSRTFALNLPTTIRFPGQVIIRAFAVDSSGNRAVSAVAETLTVVAGKTYSLPAGSQIADAIYNVRRRELYLSNYARDRVEVFSLTSNSFVASIPVGSRPWGLAMWPRPRPVGTPLATDTLYADTLIVANSGGTNLSIVDVTPSVRREVRRHRLPGYLVEKVKVVDAGAGGKKLEITNYDFSDRPQFVGAVCRAGAGACDSVVAVYSTTPTSGQPALYNRRGYMAWENITRTSGSPIGQGHFFWEQATVGVGTMDTLQLIAVRDTIPGQPIRDTIVGGAAGQLVDFERLAFQDTTYVRNSGNFLRALIGEGGGGLTLARVMTYDGTSGMITLSGDTSFVVPNVRLDSTAHWDLGISPGVQVQDFIGNRASSVTSIASNFTGGTNLVRADSIYVFNSILRQTGMLQVSGDAHGMDLAPLHAFTADVRGTNTVPADSDADARIVFAARPDSSIDVFDTYFFGEVTDTAVAGVPIPIRNALVGAVRVTPDSGGTVLTGITNQGLVVVRLPHLVNPFMAPAIPMPTVALPGAARARPGPRARGASPPNE